MKFFDVLQLILVVLKVFDLISISWLLVFSPLWIIIILSLISELLMRLSKALKKKEVK